MFPLIQRVQQGNERASLFVAFLKESIPRNKATRGSRRRGLYRAQGSTFALRKKSGHLSCEGDH